MSTHGKPVGCAAQNANPSKLQAMARDQNFTLGRVEAAITTMRGIIQDCTVSVTIQHDAHNIMRDLQKFQKRLKHDYEFVRELERNDRSRHDE